MDASTIDCRRSNKKRTLPIVRPTMAMYRTTSMNTTTLVLLALAWCGVPSAVFVDATFTTNVCFRTISTSVDSVDVVAPAAAAQPVAGALVRCFDRDWGRNDRVGHDAYTDRTGCVSIQDDQWWWEHPDVFCVVYANGDGCFSTTTTPILNNHSTRNSANLGTIDLPFDERNCWTSTVGNGCGSANMPLWMREFLNGASGFESQCLVHDACYDSCGSIRSECDLHFYHDMASTCMGRWPCRFAAVIFHWTVSFFGQMACKSARRHKCSSIVECEI